VGVFVRKVKSDLSRSFSLAFFCLSPFCHDIVRSPLPDVSSYTLDFPASRTVGHKSPYCKLSSLWYSVISTQNSLRHS
jgi:hypothetical protein